MERLLPPVDLAIDAGEVEAGLLPTEINLLNVTLYSDNNCSTFITLIPWTF